MVMHVLKTRIKQISINFPTTAVRIVPCNNTKYMTVLFSNENKLELSQRSFLNVARCFSEKYLWRIIIKNQI